MAPPTQGSVSRKVFASLYQRFQPFRNEDNVATRARVGAVTNESGMVSPLLRGIHAVLGQDDAARSHWVMSGLNDIEANSLPARGVTVMSPLLTVHPAH